jgi:hypothetical protein
MFSEIHTNMFVKDFKKCAEEITYIRQNNKIKKIEYISLFCKYVIMNEIFTDLENYKETYGYVYMSGEELKDNEKNIYTFLKNGINETSLCQDEVNFLNKMINTEFTENILQKYIKLYEETGVENNQLCHLFKKILDNSIEFDIIE